MYIGGIWAHRGSGRNSGSGGGSNSNNVHDFTGLSFIARSSNEISLSWSVAEVRNLQLPGLYPSMHSQHQDCILGEAGVAYA